MILKNYIGMFSGLFMLFLTIRSYSIPVAVFDTGADLTNPLIQSHLWSNPNEIAGNGKDDDHNGFVDDVHGVNFSTRSSNIYDFHKWGHGTHVSGIILGAHEKIHEEIPIELMILQFDPRNPAESLYEALLYAEKFGVQIMNITFSQIMYPKIKEKDLLFTSLEEKIKSFSEIRDFYAYYGYTAQQNLAGQSFNEELFPSIFMTYQTDWHNAWARVKSTIERLNHKMLIVTSGGNSNQDLNTIQLYPQTIPSDNVIVVMNLDSAYRRYIDDTGSSNYGTGIVDVGAIGTDVASIVPTAVFSSGRAALTGTSQAAPKISRLLAKIIHGSPTSRSLSIDVLHQQFHQSLSWSDRLAAESGTGWYLKEN